jgi:eukaryotic-like serine/threonine-protein kinase
MTVRSGDSRVLKPFGIDADVLNSVLDERFRIDTYLGASNGAEVYGAFDLAMNKQVVVKVLRPRFLVGEDFGARLRQEYEILRNFDHPHIIKVQDFDQTSEGAVYFIREHLPGVALSDLVKRQGPIDVARLSVMLDQIASALDAVHNAQIIHRDIAPENILVAKDAAGNDLVKLTNFGLAKTVGETAETSKDALLSGAAVVTGSLATVSPEVAAGDRYSHVADVYSLGVVLYYALVGKMPFESKSPTNLLLMHLTQEPPKFAERESTVWVPENVESVVMAAIAKKPHQRPQSAGELAEMFREAVGQFRSGPSESSANLSPSTIMRKKRNSVNRPKSSLAGGAEAAIPTHPNPSVNYIPSRLEKRSSLSPLTKLMTVVAAAVIALIYSFRS